MKPYLAVLFVLFAAPALASKVEAITPSNMDDIRYLDEVVIQGDRTLVAARIAIREAEKRFFNRWNELNSDPQYNVVCQRYVHRCEARFVQEAQERAAWEVFGGLTGVDSGADLRVAVWFVPYIEQHQAELKRRALEMAKKDDQLKRALFERARLAAHYSALRKEKFEHRWFAR